MTAVSKNRLERTATAQWQGAFAHGEGRLSTDSGTLARARYSFPTRFGQEPGTNPEELIAAAHAGCYSMALAYALGQAGAPPLHIETAATLILEMSPSGPRVTGIHLRTRAQVVGIDEDAFVAVAQQAKENCLVSRLLNAAVGLDAVLVR
ncbi:OsmC family protein [Burkholderia sp. H160]|nr:OsmC family protein [Burkholderia sp. H160]